MHRTFNSTCALPAPPCLVLPEKGRHVTSPRLPNHGDLGAVDVAIAETICDMILLTQYKCVFITILDFLFTHTFNAVVSLIFKSHAIITCEKQKKNKIKKTVEYR